MKYFTANHTSNGIYSIDNIRFCFELREDSVQNVYNYFNNINRADIIGYKPSFKSYDFKFLFKIDCLTSSYSVGLSFNGDSKQDNLKGFIDVNPNKCFLNPQCIEDIKFVSRNSFSFSFKRFDFALDLPFSRDMFVLHKDKRTYKIVMNSDLDKTEYLGRRNNSGFFKLYNKTLESNLDYDLTRLELTVDYELICSDSFKLPFPDVYIKRFNNESLDFSSLSASQRLLVDLLRDRSDALLLINPLPNEVKKKIKPFLLKEFDVVLPDLAQWVDLVHQYKQICMLH